VWGCGRETDPTHRCDWTVRIDSDRIGLRTSLSFSVIKRRRQASKRRSCIDRRRRLTCSSAIMIKPRRRTGPKRSCSETPDVFFGGHSLIVVVYRCHSRTLRDDVSVGNHFSLRPPNNPSSLRREDPFLLLPSIVDHRFLDKPPSSAAYTHNGDDNCNNRKMQGRAAPAAASAVAVAERDGRRKPSPPPCGGGDNGATTLSWRSSAQPLDVRSGGPK
jgi:hypothetical protein